MPADWAAIDVLVNNAGLALGLEPAHQASLDDWQTMIDTNCTGLVQCGGTEFSAVRFHGDEDKAAKVYQDVQPLTAEDIADTIYWIATRPAHVNINTIEMMPVAQSFARLAVHRG